MISWVQPANNNAKIIRYFILHPGWFFAMGFKYFIVAKAQFFRTEMFIYSNFHIAKKIGGISMSEDENDEDYDFDEEDTGDEW